MAESLKWNFAIQASGGPTIAATGDLGADVDTYHKGNVTIPAGGTLDVQLLTGTGGKVKLLLINPTPPSDKVAFVLNGNDVALDGPLVLIGAGAASLYGDVGTIKFKNGGTADAQVSLLAARHATP